MPRLRVRLPKYRLHKASGQAVVTLDGKDVYLGKWNSPESKGEYHRVVGEWQTAGGQAPERIVRHSACIAELILGYLRHAETYYKKHGELTSSIYSVRSAMRVLQDHYGRANACDFGPLALKRVREEMIAKGWTIKTINKQVGIIKHLFKWAASNELVPAEIHQCLQTVEGLRRGRSTAKETEPVKPVPEFLLKGVLTIAPPHLKAMIELQLFTGMRPGEIVIMRGCDLDTTGNVWVYTPIRHKNEHRNRGRQVFLGGRSQTIVQRFLKADTTAYLFDPAEAEAERSARRRENRKSPLTPSQAARTPKRNRKCPPRARYDKDSYRRAVERLCDAAFPPPAHLISRKVEGKGGRERRETAAEWKRRLGPARWAELRSWRKAHRWSPNRLRHNAATFLRKEFGLEAARVVLGHGSAAVTEVYAELDHKLAASIMSEVG